MALTIAFLGRQPVIEVSHRLRTSATTQVPWTIAAESFDEWRPVAEIVSAKNIQKLAELWALTYRSEGDFDFRIYD
jgi:hypothetical protein